MEKNFECHITTRMTRPAHADLLNNLAALNGWKTSKIEGDPLLGDELFFYFTCHSGSYARIFDKMEILAWIVAEHGFPVLRKKIEQVVYDTKTNLIPSAIRDSA